MASPAVSSAVPAAAPEPQRLSRALLALTLLALTSSSLSALSLYHTLALKAEVVALRTEFLRRREEQRSASAQPSQDRGEGPRSSGETKSSAGEVPADPRPGIRNLQRRSAGQAAVATGKSGSIKCNCSQELKTMSQPCLQMMPDSGRSLTQKDSHTAIPWQIGLERGSALERGSDTILVKEEGFYFVYGQVYYMDKTFAMGHIIVRRKKNVVGDELQMVTLFRCIQNMDPQNPYNTCYTAGVVKLEEGDQVELLIPRKTANISLDGDSTFFGAFKLA